MTVKLIREDGTEQDFSAQFECAPSMDWIGETAGFPRGYREIVHIIHPKTTLDRPVGAQLVVHEEGRLIDLPRNEKATELYQRLSKLRGQDNPHWIAGPAMYLDGRHRLS